MQKIPPMKLLGFAAGITIVFVWSGWIVASRSGATSALTVFDIAALRFGVSGLIALPIVLYYKPWRTMSISRIFVISQLTGITYFLAVITAFNYAPAAHGGVFMNGILPAITIALGWFWFRDRPHIIQVLGASLIIIGASITLFGDSGATTDGAWKGDLLFMLAGLFFAFYMVVSKMWSITFQQIMLCSPVVNGILYVPVWYFFLPSGMADATIPEIALQGVYQGMIATLVGLVLVAFAVRQIGAPIAAALMSAVPALAAGLGYFILGEEFNLTGWISLMILTPGIILTAVWNKPPKAKLEKA
ncbi:MAG: DMT family transporter [Pseudomonas marincola]